MYENFFGFTERPFQLVPNPAYLFLSKSHEEALAHLSYAASQGDGFVEITGEVGTGKTTLCRAFLEKLGPETEVAYIFNPKLTPVQLLKSINEELNIDSKAETTQELVVQLNKFLLHKKREGKSVILLIDEAQNLSRDTLEQLRLISNLETSTSKLIQIILVGQPELKQLLDSPTMRQLSQRIALSCHLRPLNLAETRAYIQHRLWVASRNAKSIITPWACLAVYRFSRGLPRLINIACDRALLTAFGLGISTVTRPIARKAILELSSRRRFRSRSMLRRESLGTLAGLTLGLFLLYLFPFSFLSEQGTVSENLSPTFSIQATTDLPKSASKGHNDTLENAGLQRAAATRSPEHNGSAYLVAAKESSPGVQMSLAEYFNDTSALESRKAALQAVLAAWHLSDVISPTQSDLNDPGDFFRTVGNQNGLRIMQVQSDLELLKKLNLPAILKCSLPQGTSPLFAALTRVKGDSLLFETSDPELTIQSSKQQFEVYWDGEAYVLWKNFLNLEGMIPREHSKEDLANLKDLLQEIGFQDLGGPLTFNDRMQEAVQQLQARHGLQVDGLVGPRTKIMLYNELDHLQIPRLITPSGNIEDKP